MVVNFWFSTCEPCKREIPALNAAAKRFGAQVSFVGINPNDTIESAKTFLQKYGVEYPNYLDDGEQLSAAGVATMPTTIFISTDGIVTSRHSGEISEKDIAVILLKNFGVSA